MLFTIVAVTIWHETWFYWMHRLMHRKGLYRLIHLFHRKSTNPSQRGAVPQKTVQKFRLKAIFFLLGQYGQYVSCCDKIGRLGTQGAHQPPESAWLWIFMTLGGCVIPLLWISIARCGIPERPQPGFG